jgi:hypothetical protein
MGRGGPLAGDANPAGLAAAVIEQADPRWRRDSFTSEMRRRAAANAGSEVAEAARKRFGDERQSMPNPLLGS